MNMTEAEKIELKGAIIRIAHVLFDIDTRMRPTLCERIDALGEHNDQQLSDCYDHYIEDVADEYVNRISKNTTSMVKLLSVPHCGMCMQAKRLLATNNIDYEYIDADSEEGERYISEYNIRNLPALFVDGQPPIRNLAGIMEYIKEQKK